MPWVGYRAIFSGFSRYAFECMLANQYLPWAAGDPTTVLPHSSPSQGVAVLGWKVVSGRFETMADPQRLLGYVRSNMRLGQ